MHYIIQKSKKIFNLFKNYKNWKEIYISLIKKQKPSKVILRNNIQINAPINNTILSMVNEIFFRKIYTPSYFSIEPDDIVVDIGANIGIFTLFAALKTKCAVYAYEPFPENVEFLKSACDY